MAYECLHKTWFRLKGIFQRKQLERDIEDEIAFHMSKREESLRKDAGPVEAGAIEHRLEAHRRFGNLTRTRESAREAWSFHWLETLWQDVRHSFRVMRKNPGFTFVAVLILGLGIGVNASVFSILNAAVLRGLPVPNAGDVVSISQVFSGHFSRSVSGEGSLVSYPEYKDYRDQSHVFEGLVGFAPFQEATLGLESPQRLNGQLVTCNYFDVLHIAPALGRGFVESECAKAGESAVIVLSDKVWRGIFDADPAIIGKTIRLNRTAFNVIGIAPPNFDGTEFSEAQFWAPVTMQKAVDPGQTLLSNDNMSWLMLIGRLRPGVTLEEVRADLGVIAARADQSFPGRHTQLGIQQASVFNRPEERPFVFGAGAVVLAAVGLVLLVVCANLANLFLARMSGRAKEMSIRLALGATRIRLVRQIVTESLIIALLGGASGMVLAGWSAAGIVAFVAARLPKDEIGAIKITVGPDWHVLVYTFLISVLTCLAFGLIPALRVSKVNLNEALKLPGNEGGSGRRGKSLPGRVLVCVQVSFSMILLIAAGLALRGLYHAQTIDPGIEMKDTAVVTLDLKEEGYTTSQAAQFQRELGQRLTALVGVERIAEAWTSPLSGSHSESPFTISGTSYTRQIEFNNISPGFFSVLGIPIVRGRDFTEADAASAGHAVIITEAAARKWWPNEDPIGKELTGADEKEILVVVGVAKDANYSRLSEAQPVLMFLPVRIKDQNRMQLLVHNRRGYAPMAAEIQRAVHTLDPEILVNVASLESNLELWRMPWRIAAIVGGVLGGLTLALASLGVYGMVSYAVGRRTREIGIRMALGARGGDVRNLIVRQAMRPVMIGIIIGLAGAAALAKILSAMLFGLSAHDPVAFLSVPAFLFAVALIACYFPARRAIRVDPNVVLRYE